MRLNLSPDGKWLGFWATGPEGGLYLLELATGQTRRLVSAPGPQWRGYGGGGDFSWSPDMRWVAYALRGESRAWNIWIIPMEGGQPVNVTRLFAQHGQPCWSPDGKYLYFQSHRDGPGLYVLPLTRGSARTIDTDLKFEKSTNKVEVKIEFEDGKVRLTRRGLRQYFDGKELAVPSHSFFDPNTRPDSAPSGCASCSRETGRRAGRRGTSSATPSTPV